MLKNKLKRFKLTIMENKKLILGKNIKERRAKMMEMKIVFEFMVEMDLPIPFDEEFLLMVPRQRAMVNRLMNEGIIISYAVSFEKGKLWLTMLADSEAEVFSMISEFPIIRFVETRISKLAFHNSVGFQIPHFSVN